MGSTATSLPHHRGHGTAATTRYHQGYDTFADSFDLVVASSRAKGARRVVWLSYPEGVDYLLPNGLPGSESLVNINQIMRDELASGAFPGVVIADWFNYASASPTWFNRDDIHLSPYRRNRRRRLHLTQGRLHRFAALPNAPRTRRPCRGSHHAVARPTKVSAGTDVGAYGPYRAQR